MKRADAKILVADDSASMRLCISYLLREAGIHFIDEAVNGAVAFTMFRRKNYDLVISDWTMPIVDGLELLSAVRGGRWRNDIPVVLLTAGAREENHQLAMATGATGLVRKPFFNPSLNEQVVKLIAKR
jgi:two-component system chemotaxis response regulator CheY